MRFEEEMKRIAFFLESKQKYNVLQCVYNIDNLELSLDEKNSLEKAHFRKIDISDAIYVIDIDGYIGSQVEKEIAYAEAKGKEVIFYSNSNIGETK